MMTSNSDSLKVSIRTSGNGFELLDSNGDVVAWTFSRQWALKILLGLELLDGRECQEPNEDGDAS